MTRAELQKWIMQRGAMLSGNAGTSKTERMRLQCLQRKLLLLQQQQLLAQ
jgi:hypothetical protein